MSTFHKVRYYGILTPAVRHRLNDLQAMLEETALKTPRPICEKTEKPAVWETTLLACPHCEQGMLFLVAVYFRPYRAPPQDKEVFNTCTRTIV